MNQRASREEPNREARQSASPIATTAVTASTFLGPGLFTAHSLG
jgi:hypothetical protein